MTRTLIRRLPLPLRVAIQLVVPTGVHRARRTPAALATQAFRFCETCGVETAAAVYPGGTFACTEGHVTVPGGGV